MSFSGVRNLYGKLTQQIEDTGQARVPCLCGTSIRVYFCNLMVYLFSLSADTGIQSDLHSLLCNDQRLSVSTRVMNRQAQAASQSVGCQITQNAHSVDSDKNHVCNLNYAG